MAQAKTWAAFDVHVSGVVAATLERDSGELRVQRLPGRSDAVVEFVESLPGSVRATYEAGPTGYAVYWALTARVCRRPLSLDEYSRVRWPVVPGIP